MHEAKKQLGQNFLTDKNKVNEIISSIPNLEDSFVIEVGPGTGALTTSLDEKSKGLTVIELDSDLIPVLEELKLSNTTIIHSDVLKVDFDELVKEDNNAFVSNLPYYISSKILFKAIENEKFNSISVMMQKELVDRIISDHGSKQYGRLSVAVRSYYDVESTIKVPANCFSPKPEVESAFINLTKNENGPEEVEEYLKFIKSSFAHKRKTFLNSLKTSGSKWYPFAKDYIEVIGLQENVRSEQIDVETFINIWNSIKHN